MTPESHTTTDETPPGEFPSDPYAEFRADGHAVVDLGSQQFPLFVGYDDVRNACRDWTAFTSDTPFEVPIPSEHGVRDVRQLPIETDPPRHTAYRALVAQFFTRAAVERHTSAIQEVVDPIITSGLDTGPIEVVSQLALPVVNHGLAAALGRPPQEADRWLRWGIHVFDTDDTGEKGPNRELEAYLAEVIDTARAAPGDDFFGTLATSEIDGRPITREEMLGFGNLVFAGGRDTVAGSIAAAVWYFATNPAQWARIRADPSLVRSAVEEIIRLSSPLPFIGRHATAPCRHAGVDIESGQLVALGFAAANRDPAAFDQPDICLIDRNPNRHIAFGHGPHTCSGAHLARMEIRVTLERLAELADHIELAEPVRFKTMELDGNTIPFGLGPVTISVASSHGHPWPGVGYGRPHDDDIR